MPLEIAFDVDLRAKAAAGTAEGLIFLPPFAPAAETCARMEVLSIIWIRPALRLHALSAWKNASKLPACDRRENRFQMLFHGPNSAGSTRQVMLGTVKECSASRNRRSFLPVAPRLDRTLRKISTTRSQSSSVIRVSMVGSLLPTRHQSHCEFRGHVARDSGKLSPAVLN